VISRRWTAPCLLGLVLAAACADDAAPSSEGSRFAARSGRFGSLRDFYLLEGADGAPGEGLLVDRFEATQRDWMEFAATASGAAVAADQVPIVGRLSLPVGGVDLVQARAFARWRCGRLPSEAEWSAVAQGGGSGPFPWGSKEDATRANTGDLALGERMPVGTFESGRRSGGDAPYDLVGNVREWTETVPLEWCQEGAVGDASAFGRSARRALQAPALRAWADRFGVLPAGVLVAVGGDGVPRRCVGADYETPMRDVFERQYDTQAAGERRQRTGLRVYTTVGELWERLVSIDDVLAADERAQVVAFARRAGNRAAFRRAIERSPQRSARPGAGTAAAALLDEVLRKP